MKKLVFKALILVMCLLPLDVFAQRGCCSQHGGVSGNCSSDGKQICNDGKISPSCTCTPTITTISGCTDKSASNYNPNANKDNGSCIYYIYGCTDKTAQNYNEKATKDDGSCTYYVYGCTDKTAQNYNEKATKDDGSCTYYVYGCTDETAKNYNEKANKDDGSCKYEEKVDTTDTEKQESNDDFISGLMAINFLGFTTTGGAAGVYYLLKSRKK